MNLRCGKPAGAPAETPRPAKADPSVRGLARSRIMTGGQPAPGLRGCTIRHPEPLDWAVALDDLDLPSPTHVTGRLSLWRTLHGTWRALLRADRYRRLWLATGAGAVPGSGAAFDVWIDQHGSLWKQGPAALEIDETLLTSGLGADHFLLSLSEDWSAATLDDQFDVAVGSLIDVPRLVPAVDDEVRFSDVVRKLVPGADPEPRG